MNFIILFLFLLVSELAFFKIASHFNIVDKPNNRSSHSQSTLRGGGIIFLFTAVYWYVQYRENSYFITGLILISIVSFLDDIGSLSNRLRLLFHFIAVAMLIYDTGLIVSWYKYILIFIMIVGIINAFNFMDGINGITGLYSMGWLASFAVTVLLFHLSTDLQLIWMLMIAVLIFLFFNFRKKAICFSGDIGSISISFICCFMLIKLIILLDSFVPLLFISLYGIDTVITIIFRLIRRENIFLAHRTHLYQFLANEYRIDHRLIAAGYLLIQLLLNAWVLYAFCIHLPTSIIFLVELGLLAAGYLFLRLRLQDWNSLTGIKRA